MDRVQIEPLDYFETPSVLEVDLSPNGDLFSYRIERADPVTNQRRQQVFFGRTDDLTSIEEISAFNSIRQMQWIAGTEKLAVLSADDGASQVFIYDIDLKTVHRVTHTKSGVLDFAVDPSGTQIAWRTVTNTTDRPETLYNRMRNDTRGIVAEHDALVLYQFVNAAAHGRSSNIPAAVRLYISGFDSEPRILQPEKSVRTYYWSPDSLKLSITYTEASEEDGVDTGRDPSMGVVRIEDGDFTPLFVATPRSEDKRFVHFVGGEWSGDGERIYVRRVSETDRRTRLVEWVSFPDSSPVEIQALKWQETSFYPGDKEPAFTIGENGRVLSLRTQNARSLVFENVNEDWQRSDRFNPIGMDIAQISFDQSASRAILVAESIDRPQEVYLQIGQDDLFQITDFANGVEWRTSFKAEEVFWESEDGVTIQGWLYKPAWHSHSSPPLPMITFVHGGPVQVMPNKFASYLRSSRGGWPYPLELLAIHGIAVFVPNYRGTGSFSESVPAPTMLDLEPLDDIESGIQFLVDRGTADSRNLGIAGHSHGAWLGALLLSRAVDLEFSAASFAEGAFNQILNYELTSGWLNRRVHDSGFGAALYSNPERYIELSPSLGYHPSNAAILFEGGSKSLALSMIGAPKAAANSGMPVEFIIYPNTGHSIVDTRLKLEAAERNLDWFSFWMLGVERQSKTATNERHQRWQSLRSSKCSTSGDLVPVYCLEH